MSAVGLRATVGVAEPGTPLRRIVLRGVDADRRAALLTREWLVTNGLGGYAPGQSVARHRGVITAS